MGACLNTEQQALVVGSIGLVYRVMKDMHIKNDFEDFYSIGCIGLCDAALHWQPGGVPFSTYAYHFIRHALIRQFRYLSRGKRSGAKLESLTDTQEALAANDERFEKLEMKAALRVFADNMDTLLGRDDAEIIRLLASGKSIRQTAERMDCPLSAVRHTRKRAAACLTQWLNS